MSRELSIIRIILVALACSHICGFSQNRLTDQPLGAPCPKQVMTEEFPAQFHPLATLNYDDSDHDVAFISREDFYTLGFRLDNNHLIVTAPGFAILEHIDQSPRGSLAVQDDHMRNKDPPSLAG